MDQSSYGWIFEASWVRRNLSYAACLAAILAFGSLTNHEPVGWIVLAPFAGSALVIIGLSLAVALRQRARSDDSRTGI
jgi:hypothetical protein